MLNFRWYQIYPIFVINLLVLLSNYSYAQAPGSLISTIDNALDSRCLDTSQTAASVVSLPSGRPIYNHNSLQPLLPASVMKIVTTAAALHYLSPEYRFKTLFMHTGQRQGDVIQGDLIIRGGGDPRLSTEQLWRIATQIKASGINEITGDLIVDAHFFDTYDRAPSWEIERTQKAYDAKLAALSLNFNTISVHLQPSQIGDLVRTWLEPATPYIQLQNTAKTIQRGKTIVSAYRSSEESVGTVDLFVRGKLPVGSQEKVIRLNIDNPIRYAAETFKAILQQTGVKIEGVTKISYKPVAGHELYYHLSDPLSLILKELNTFSNNFMAEQILKTIAAEKAGTPGSHENGLKLVEEFLQLSHVNTQGVILQDGSGLSRKNRMTTQAITDVLSSLYSRFDIGPDFVTALRVMGADGVLSQRLAKSPARGQIRAKTGTLNRVSTLAGYVATPHGKVFAYAIFLNNNGCGPWRADRIEDRIVNTIHELGDNTIGYTASIAQ